MRSLSPRNAEIHHFVVISDEIAVAVGAFDLLVQSVHDIAYTLVEQAVLILEMGVESAAVDERALADIDDGDGPERLLVEQLVKRVDDSLTRR